MTECQRCGKCCHFIDENNQLRKCRYLIKLPSGKTLCRVYRNRFKVTIAKVGDKVAKCLMRKDSPFDYEGCPFNTNKPLFEKELEAMRNGNNPTGQDGDNR